MDNETNENGVTAENNDSTTDKKKGKKKSTKTFTHPDERPIRKRDNPIVRFLKNLLIWIAGVLFGVIGVVAAVFGVAKLTPIKDLANLVGVDTSSMVSENVTNYSLINLFYHLDSVKMSDVMILSDAIKDFLDNEQIKKFVTLNEDVFDNLSINNIGDAIFNSFTICDIEEIYLTDIIPDDAAHHDMYAVLTSALGKDDASDIQVKDFTEFSADNVYLKTVLPRTGNETIDDILESGTGIAAASLKISDLANFSAEKASFNPFHS